MSQPNTPPAGQQQNVSPFRANAGYALKMRSPDVTMIRMASAAAQWVTRTTQWWRTFERMAGSPSCSRH